MKSIGAGRYAAIAAVGVAAAGAWTADAASFSEPTAKTFIAAGWDVGSLTPRQLLADADKFAGLGFDGVAVNLRISDITMTQPIDAAKLRGEIAPLRELSVRPGFTHSFLGCNWAPVAGRRLDWRDDARWKVFEENMRLIAQVAKEGGLVGILVDWEDYGLKGQFHRAAGDPPYAEAAALARRRGRAIGDLYGPFLDGVFDVMPATRRWISLYGAAQTTRAPHPPSPENGRKDKAPARNR